MYHLRELGIGFLDRLRNKYIAFGFMALILVGGYYLEPLLWKYIFSALISYFIATVVMRYSLARGLFNVKHFGKNLVSEGHAFMVFVFIIIFATLFSNWIANYIQGIVIINAQEKLIVVLVQTVIILVLLLLDMEFEF